MATGVCVSRLLKWMLICYYLLLAVPHVTSNPPDQCSFEEVLAEPESIRSIDCVWKLSYTCFNCWLNLCYKISTLCCGICIAAEWGCEFAGIAFWHIWYITPLMRVMEINCSALQKIYSLCVSCCLEPCCIACGRIFKSFEKS